ncbi:EscU/YscU/HrcU family type III secretion system export apparatus switch protein [Serpentinicella sp. ANB-PHB4]|uniref:EscU/YscU/HrcU family type III secretion system export apparatus switch protein n=1 Tax=Serpentinicella sp. ANB-PHB4 TaxID=3074076 RepID=UPI00285E81EE|nr:EscU/YscU/HrcU family type III secretion system export apparatus switch protein [Serpentinicella sp. ANB-PHB4]MDR5659804.1 EscU/YscU/HrcU family type III secretion system export apparatus switch protein [Serpentinicella sp. ANB-PHB4]
MDKNKKALALEYDAQRQRVPKITATGRGIVAENIIKKAEENDVFIYEDERLVKELMQFQVGAEIPEELYEIVAQILVFVESVDREKGKEERFKF